MIEGISHVTFVVADLERAAAFFTRIFDAREVYASGDDTFSIAREKFFLVGGQWLAIMEGRPQPGRTYDHVAFKVPEDRFEAYAERVRALGVDCPPPRPRVEGEGLSLYFYDFDNHLFEIHTGTLAARLARYGAEGEKKAGPEGPA